MVEENFLNENIEYTDDKNEEDPLLVAQRYLNIFHQIHIFNQNKQEEFDQSLMDVPTRIRESIATIPGGRVLLEYIQDLEKKHGRTSEKIANFPSKGNKTSTTSSNSGAIAPAGVVGNLSIGPEFAETLANSLATALKNNNIGGNAGASNSEELSRVLSQSFKSYASNMQQFTQALITQTQQSASLVKQAQSQNIAQQAQSSPLNTQNQQNLQTNNSNSTTINNINMDTTFIDKLANVLVNNDNKRHEDFMQLLQVLKHQKNSAPITVMNPTTNTPIVNDTSYVEEAIRENNAMQLQAIKSFGEMIVEAITQSQKELAQTIAQSTPRHTVKVVVSQDVDVEDQTNGNSIVKQDNNKNPSKDTNKKEDTSKDKNSFIKNISNKISETTNKLATPKNNASKPTENFLDKINKGLNSFKEEIKKQPIIGNQENKKNPQTKEQPKENKQIVNEKKQNNIQSKQSEIPTKDENKSQNYNEKIKNKSVEPIKEKAIEDILFPDGNKDIKPLNIEPTSAKTKEIDVTEADFNDILLDELLDIKEENPIIKNTQPVNTLDKIGIVDTTPINPTPKTQPITNQAPAQHKPQSTTNQATTHSQPLPQSKPQPNTNTNVSQSHSETSTPYKATTSSYVDALEKIKDALSGDVSKVMNDDITPISLNETDDIKINLTPTNNSPAPINNDDEWEYVEDNSDGEWEYVDENGNPVGNDAEWEYIDDNGNPVEDDDEWEYVEDNSDGEWEYVDENGNPVENDDEWEYVEDTETK